MWFSRDGHSLRAATVDSLRCSVDVATGGVERLLDNDQSGIRERLMDDEATFFTLYARRAAAMKEHERGFWREPHLAARFPSLPAGVESNGLALGVLAEIPGGRGRRLEPLGEIEATGDGEQARLFVAGSDGRIRAFDMDGRQVAEGAAPAGAEMCASAWAATGCWRRSTTAARRFTTGRWRSSAACGCSPNRPRHRPGRCAGWPPA